MIIRDMVSVADAIGMWRGSCVYWKERTRHRVLQIEDIVPGTGENEAALVGSIFGRGLVGNRHTINNDKEVVTRLPSQYYIVDNVLTYGDTSPERTRRKGISVRNTRFIRADSGRAYQDRNLLECLYMALDRSSPTPMSPKEAAKKMYKGEPVILSPQVACSGGRIFVRGSKAGSVGVDGSIKLTNQAFHQEIQEAINETV